MKKKLSPEKLIVIVGIIFATVLVLVNVFFDFVPHTVKTENINATATTEFSTYYNQNVNKKTYTTTQKVIVNINTASAGELTSLSGIVWCFQR